MMRTLISTLLLTILFLPISRAQSDGPEPSRTYEVSGQVMDEDSGEPLEYATVKLLQQPDSSLLTGSVTDNQGTFSISTKKAGAYWLEVHYIGYDIALSEVTLNRNNPQVNMGTIQVHPSAQNLDEVTVQGNKHAMDYRIDKKILHVSKQFATVSGTAVDVLQNAPSVKVDIEGNVSLRGNSNFTVLIDDRPTVLNATEALEQIPASMIQDIEIITNPSAKYDPEGTAGIINIITKKRTLKGINGIANLNVGLDDKYGGDLLLNYRADQLNVFVGADYNNRTYPGSMQIEQESYNGDTTLFLNSEGDRARMRERYSVRGGFEWFPNEKNTFSLSGRYGSRLSASDNTTDYEEYTSFDQEPTRYFSEEERQRGGIFYSIESNYTYKFKPRNHQFDAQFMLYHREGEEENINSLYTTDNSISSSQKSLENGPATGMRYRLNYKQRFTDALTIESGMQGRYGNSDETNEIYELNTTTNEYLLQDLFSHDVNYMRNIHAGYGLVQGEMNQLGYQLGLRAEYTYREINLNETGEDFTINRWDYFPTAHFSYQLTDKDQLMASYTRRIDRPRGWYLEPFITWSDAYNVRRGNPGLKPEYINSYEVAYQKEFDKNALTIEGYYRTTQNKIEGIRRLYRDNIIMRTYENVGTDYSLGVEVMLNTQPIKWWEADFTGTVYHYRVAGQLNDVEFDEESLTWDVRWNNTFTLAENTRLQVNPSYEGPEVEPQEREPGNFRLDAALRQSFFDKKLQATVQARNVLGTARYESFTTAPDFESHRIYEYRSPIVMLNITWRINNYKNRNGGGRGGDMGGMGGDDM